MFGTKCPSITSRWRKSAPPCSTSSISDPSFAKSADRIDGAIWGMLEVKGLVVMEVRGLGVSPKVFHTRLGRRAQATICATPSLLADHRAVIQLAAGARLIAD